MVDTKISALPAVTTPAGTDEFGVNQGGASKKMTLSQIRSSLPTVPTIISVGTEFHSTAAPTATLPATHALNDILLLILQSANDSLIATPTGYARIGPQNGIGAAATAGSTKLAIFWKRDNGSESAPTIADTGDHTYGVILAIRGCVTTGDPFHLLGVGWKFTASTAASGPKGATTTIRNSLVMDIFAHGIDSATAQASAPICADLTSLTEQFDGGTTDGTGGGFAVITGVKASPGDIAVTTMTWAAATVEVSSRIAWVPDDAFYKAGRPTEIQTFIGSPADLDDVWTMPEGARRIFVQFIDGGGSGSGGNTTTTAEGGGGGGGGGYDEAWYYAEDFSNGLATLHAGKGGAVGTALVQAGNPGVISQFHTIGPGGPLISGYRVAGTAATAAASADGGNGGCGSGRGTVSPNTSTVRVTLEGSVAGAALGGRGGSGGAGTTANVGGSPAEWGGGGGESGADTDAALAASVSGYSLRGGGGGGGGRTTTPVGLGAGGGGAQANGSGVQGGQGGTSSHFPYGGSGGNGGGSAVATGGTGGFPGGGGGGGGGVAGGFGGAGGHGMVVVTTFFS